MPRKKTKPGHKAGEIKIRVAPEDKQLFDQAAKQRGLSLSAWLRMVALDAARATAPTK